MVIKPIRVQRRFAEVGRIRLGQLETNSAGKKHPAKLNQMRFTSASRPLLDKVAAAYGGRVGPWTPANGGTRQWEVIVTADRIPVLVPPGAAVTSHMELWSGGGCLRRCDYETEMLSGQPCLCRAQRREACTPHTRLSVMLRDIEGLGVWRLESQGEDAAAELPLSVEFLRHLGPYVEAWLYLRPRRKPVRGQLVEWNVPTLGIEGITPGQLRQRAVSAADTAPTAVAATEPTAVAEQAVAAVAAASTPALQAVESASAAVEAVAKPASEPTSAALAAIKRAQSVDELTAIVQRARASGVPDRQQVEDAAIARRAEFPALAEQLWVQIVVAAAPELRTSQLQDMFAAANQGLDPSSASPAQLQQFLHDLKAGGVRPAA